MKHTLHSHEYSCVGEKGRRVEEGAAHSSTHGLINRSDRVEEVQRSELHIRGISLSTDTLAHTR